jgi:long-subunit fatty acid transport protein
MALAVQSVQAQNAVMRDGLGATAAGRGSTNVAHSDNGEIILSNPAGMANIDGQGLFEVGLDVIDPHVHYTDPLNDANSRWRPIPLPDFSYIRRIDGGNLAYGLGIYGPAGFGITYNLNDPVFGPQKYESFSALLKVLPALAYQVTDRLSIGGTFGAAVNTVQLETPFRLQTGLLAGAPVLLHLHGQDATPAWSVGAQYKLGDCTSLGINYIEESRFHLDGKADAVVAGVAPVPLYSNFDSRADLIWPRSLTFGLTHQLGDRQRVSLEGAWINWSNAFSDLGLRLTNPSNPAFAALGPVITDRIPLNWEDGWSVRLGYEYLLTACDVLRAGYIYDTSVIPTTTLTPLIPGTLEHTFTLGYGHQWTHTRFDVAYHFSYGDKLNVGESALAGGEFNNSSVKTWAHTLFLSWQYQF